jgi:hypothetical protein
MLLLKYGFMADSYSTSTPAVRRWFPRVSARGFFIAFRKGNDHHDA